MCVCVCVFLEGYNQMRNEKVRVYIDRFRWGVKREKIGLIMGNSKVYFGGHKTLL